MRPDEELKQLMAAARAGANDLASPEFARLRAALASDSALSARFQRSQALDAAIASAFKSVEVPVGLSDRILSQFRAGKVVDSATDVDTTTDNVVEVAGPVVPDQKNRGLSRRSWLAIAGLGATAA